MNIHVVIIACGLVWLCIQICFSLAKSGREQSHTQQLASARKKESILPLGLLNNLYAATAFFLALLAVSMIWQAFTGQKPPSLFWILCSLSLLYMVCVALLLMRNLSKGIARNTADAQDILRKAQQALSERGRAELTGEEYELAQRQLADMEVQVQALITRQKLPWWKMRIR